MAREGTRPAGVELEEYVVQRRLGVQPGDDGAAGGEMWLVREADDVGEVLVHVLALPADAAARDDLLERARRCQAARGPQLARGRGLLVGTGAVAMLWDVPSGRPWVDGAGSPLELERGRSMALRLGLRLVDAASGGAWVTSAGRVLVVPTPVSPTTDAVATRPEPDADDGSDSAMPDPSGSRRPPRRAVHGRRRPPLDRARTRTVGVLIGLVVAAGALGVLSLRWFGADVTDTARLSEPTATSLSSTTGPAVVAEAEPEADAGQSVDWTTVVSRLDDRRAGAYAAADPAMVASFAVQGSPAAEQDSAILRDLRARGVRAVGYRSTLERVDPVSVEAERVVLTVVDALSPYRLVDGSGRVVAESPARDSTSWVVELARSDDDWRLVSVSRA